MKKRLVQLLSLFLCLLFLPLAASAAEAPGPSVRVLLRRLNLTDRADLILDGAYTEPALTDANLLGLLG